MQEETTPSAEQLVECKVCNKKMKLITKKHLLQHGLTSQEYRKLYPGCVLSKCSWFTTWRNSEENKQHLIKQAKRVVESEELSKKRDINKQIAMDDPQYHKNLSNAMKTSQKCINYHQNKVVNVTSRMKMSNFDRWVLDFGYDIAIQKQLDWQAKNVLPSCSRHTKIELLVESAFKNAGYDVITQLSVPRYYCDLYLPKFNLIIEVNGNYWHANPEFFKADDFIGQKKAQAHEIWERDKQKINDLKQMGYNVAVVWESQIKKTVPEKLVEDIVRSVEKSIELNERDPVPC
jgi:G:T-mismatch repair DNA endonuclease (very short patch repair protein)